MKNKDLKLFNRIAPFYGKFYNSQKTRYSRIFREQRDILDLSHYKNALDVGCGTGAMCAALYDAGLRVTGMDGAEKMLRIAENNADGRKIQWIQGDILDSLPFPDQSFDFSVASYVAHGMPGDEREKLYKEMARVTKEKVLVFDYNSVRNIFITIAELLEGGDYFRFIQVGEEEMRRCFTHVQVVNVDKRAAWYVCIP